MTGFVALWIQFWKGYIPKTVNPPRKDPRMALRDPIAAIVGSVALFATIVLITGLGFVGNFYFCLKL